MTRILRPAKPGLLTRLTLSIGRRKVARLTGRATEQMIEPMEAFAHAPRLLLGYGMLELASERLHGVEHRLKELATLKAATMASCEYCIDIGSALARGAGLSDAQLLSLPGYRSSPLFDEREKLVLDLATAMSRTPVEVGDELFDALREQFADAQIIELAGTIALENLRARFNAALDIGSAGFTEGTVCARPEAPPAAFDRPGAAPAASELAAGAGAAVHAGIRA